MATPTVTASPLVGPDRGRLYTPFLEQQFRDEETVRDRHKAAAGSVFTSSAAFVGLLVGVAAVALGTRTLPAAGNGWVAAAKIALIAAVVLFAVAGVLAWHVQQLRPEHVPGNVAMEAMVDRAGWLGNEEQARLVIAKHFVTQTKDLRASNAKRAASLARAGGFQFAAYGAVTVSLVFAMIGT